ncbi:MAG: hypothetical protein HY313_03325 [Acidobacteria bacterium]|nr:hypothetical protein [Acidobacteriota bacterium]
MNFRVVCTPGFDDGRLTCEMAELRATEGPNGEWHVYSDMSLADLKKHLMQKGVPLDGVTIEKLTAEHVRSRLRPR